MFQTHEKYVQKHTKGLKLFNSLNAELNPIGKSQLAELFCGVLEFYA